MVVPPSTIGVALKSASVGGALVTATFVPAVTLRQNDGYVGPTLVAWALAPGRRGIVSTSFGPFAAVTLHMATRQQPDVPVLWVDAGYGTPAQYRFADELTERLGLNLKIYRPRRSKAHREAADGPLPEVGSPGHAAFTEEVKLEPFDRALRELRGEVWITGIRAEETDERARMEPVTLARDGVIKVAPVLHWNSRQMHEYLKRHHLPNNFDYFDPTKVEDRPKAKRSYIYQVQIDAVGTGKFRLSKEGVAYRNRLQHLLHWDPQGRAWSVDPRHVRCGSFSEILQGAPGLSRTVLSLRLKQLERLGVVESTPKPDARGHHYELTSAGHDLFAVCQSLGEWGARWLEIAPENLDPFVALWSMCKALRRDRLPDRRVVIRFDFTGRPRRERYWLLIELGDTEICKTYPGLDEDLYITAEAEAFVKWHAGHLTWAQATREDRIKLDGSPSLVRAFPTWNARSMFAHIRPESTCAT